MGLNFRKSIKIADGVKLNIGKKSAGVSVGGKYAGASFNSRSGARVRASLPGTGLSYTKKVGGTKRKSSRKKSKSNSLSTILLIVVVALALCFVAYKNWDSISNMLGLGQTAAVTEADSVQTANSYVINTSTKKIHLPDCSYVDSSSKNISTTDKTLEELLQDGYEKCSRCLK